MASTLTRCASISAMTNNVTELRGAKNAIENFRDTLQRTTEEFFLIKNVFIKESAQKEE